MDSVEFVQCNVKHCHSSCIHTHSFFQRLPSGVATVDHLPPSQPIIWLHYIYTYKSHKFHKFSLWSPGNISASVHLGEVEIFSTTSNSICLLTINHSISHSRTQQCPRNLFALSQITHELCPPLLSSVHYSGCLEVFKLIHLHDLFYSPHTSINEFFSYKTILILTSLNSKAFNSSSLDVRSQFSSANSAHSKQHQQQQMSSRPITSFCSCWFFFPPGL